MVDAGTLAMSLIAVLTWFSLLLNDPMLPVFSAERDARAESMICCCSCATLALKARSASLILSRRRNSAMAC